MKKYFNVVKSIKPMGKSDLDPIYLAKNVEMHEAIAILSNEYDLYLCDIAADVSEPDYSDNEPWFIIDKPNVSIHVSIEESFHSKLATSLNPNLNKHNYCLN